MSRPAGASAASARPPLKGPAADDSDDDDSTPAAKRNEPYRTDPKADALVQDAEKRMKSFSLWDKRAKSVPLPPPPCQPRQQAFTRRPC
jgi:hypothetical protein